MLADIFQQQTHNSETQVVTCVPGDQCRRLHTQTLRLWVAFSIQPRSTVQTRKHAPQPNTKQQEEPASETQGVKAHQQEYEELAKGSSALAIVGAAVRAHTRAMTIRVCHHIRHPHTAVVVHQPQMAL